jgi:hypothetical protein
VEWVSSIVALVEHTTLSILSGEVEVKTASAQARRQAVNGQTGLYAR